MEALLFTILCIAVIALAIKLSRVTNAKAAIVELIGLTRSLEERLTSLERQVALFSKPSVADPPLTQTPSAPASADAISVTKLSALIADFAAPAADPHTPTAGRPAPPPLVQAQSSHPAPIPGRRSISLEERLGQNWLSKIGIVLVVLGIATFLGYKLVTLGPLGKSLTGLATALILLLGGLTLERKPSYRVFGRAGIGGGWALLFFTTFALYHVEAMQVLTSQTADLVLMALVASAMVWHSLRYKSQVVTVLAFLLAFATVGISEVTLFSLVAGALLAIALVFVAAREFWFELGLAGLCGVYLNHFLWLLRVLPNGGSPGRTFPEALQSVALLVFYWILFRLFYVLRVPPAGSQLRRQQLIAALTAILNSAGLLALLRYQSSHPDWTFRVLLILGLIEFLFAFIARPRSRAAFLVLASLASALLLVAIPFRFGASDWTLLWLLEAEALFLAGIIIQEKALRRLGLIAGFLAAFQVLFIDTLPLVGLRLFPANIGNQTSTAISLVAAALLSWFNSELANFLWPSLFEKESAVFDRVASRVTSFVAAACTAAFLYLEFRPEFLALAWSLLALALICAAWLLHRKIFTAQALTLLAASALRILFYNLFELSGPATSFWSARATTISMACAVMLLCLPAAFAIRRNAFAQQAAELPTGVQSDQRLHGTLLSQPEQPFFFVPFVLIAILIAIELRTGMITLGWIALALTAFLAALSIGERSYRLAGIGLLLFSLAKIVLVDIWSLSTTDRILTLIITGAVLLLVSFLYSRFRETILKFL